MPFLSKTLLSCVAAASLVACVQTDDAPSGLRTAMPTADQVAIKLPDSGGSQRSVGELAQWYVATRGVVRTFNGGTAWVLTLIHTIVQFPVTSVSGEVYTWGPWSGALDPAEYKLDVTDRGDGTYAYQLSGRSKTEANAAFEVVIQGIADPTPGELQGNGELTVDFDAGRRVNPVDAGDAKGQMSARYDLAAKHLDLTLVSTDAQGAPVSADYAYNEAADGGGDLVFDFHADAGGTPALETATLRSRWLATGAGRADGRLADGDLPGAGVTASECWSTQFRRTYYVDSQSFAPTEGNVSDCAFAAADLPPLP